ncbi:hypothetical protein BKA62DRAFT_756586 [Auriculariales sp. MPI-PUGE-AT-0066]|nr:hypothetical protein BKA62DRAFT_756586 [Auriculariales sp. MPI-PUGE-AT-0066]
MTRSTTLYQLFIPLIHALLSSSTFAIDPRPSTQETNSTNVVSEDLLKGFKHTPPPVSLSVFAPLTSRQICQNGGITCLNGDCCPFGNLCCEDYIGCCPIGTFCTRDGCCPLTQTCTGQQECPTNTTLVTCTYGSICCPLGWHCDDSGRSNTCIDPNAGQDNESSSGSATSSTPASPSSTDATRTDTTGSNISSSSSSSSSTLPTPSSSSSATVDGSTDNVTPSSTSTPPALSSPSTTGTTSPPTSSNGPAFPGPPRYRPTASGSDGTSGNTRNTSAASTTCRTSAMVLALASAVAGVIAFW